MSRRCFFREYAPEGLRDCDGQPQWHHPIKQQTIKRLFPKPNIYATDDELREYKRRLNAALRDTRNRLWACPRHHELHERAKRIPVPREALPDELEAFADEFGLAYELDRQFGARG